VKQKLVKYKLSEVHIRNNNAEYTGFNNKKYKRFNQLYSKPLLEPIRAYKSRAGATAQEAAWGGTILGTAHFTNHFIFLFALLSVKRKLRM
jgi:hypothetical protein